MIKRTIITDTNVRPNVNHCILFLFMGSFDLPKSDFTNMMVSFLKIANKIKYGIAIRNIIPLFNPRAIEFGLFSKSLSAAALHIAHCAE